MKIMTSKAISTLILLAAYVSVCHAKKVYYRENQPFTLQCTLKDHYSVKNTTYWWLKNGSLRLNISTYDDIIQKENGDIEFTEPKDYQQGSYQCFAKTMWGTASSVIYEVYKTTIEYEKHTVSHKAVEEKPYEIKCPTPKGYPVPKVYWVTQMTGSDDRKPVQDARTIQGPRDTENTLFFREITKDDANIKYLCLAESPAVDEPIVLGEHTFEEVLPGDGTNGTAVLQYVSKDAVKYLTSVDDFSQRTSLYCVYGGKKLPRPTWYKGDEKLKLNPTERVYYDIHTGGQVLAIRKTKFSDEGSYSCEFDIDGNKIIHTMKLTIVAPPIFAKNIQGDIVREGEDYTIPCYVAGNKVPTLKWTYNTEPLVESNRLFINRTTLDENVAVAHLTIKNVKLTDMGYYGCRADNDQGYGYQENLIIVQSK